MRSNLKDFVKKSYNYSFLSQEKEQALALKMAKGCQKSREKLICSHLRMVIPIAKRFSKNNGTNIEDLIQEGNLGLITAADRFDVSKNIRFAAYARWWIVEFIKRKFYKDLYIVKTPFRVVKKSFLVSQGVASKTEKKKGENLAVFNILKKPLYLGAPLFSEGSQNKTQETSLEEILSDTRETPEKAFERKDFRNFLEGRIHYYLNQKELVVLKKRYLSQEEELCPTYKNLGSLLKISSETVRNIEKRALSKLQKKLKKELNYL